MTGHSFDYQYIIKIKSSQTNLEHYSNMKEAIKWCKDNCNDSWIIPCEQDGLFLFKSEDDALMFKLTWG